MSTKQNKNKRIQGKELVWNVRKKKKYPDIQMPHLLGLVLHFSILDYRARQVSRHTSKQQTPNLARIPLS